MSIRQGSVGALLLALLSMTPTTGADPRVDYLLHCAGCHLPDGRGAPPEVPTLRGELGSIASSPVGRGYLVRVPGASQAPIDDAALTRVVNWILAEFNADTLSSNFVPLSVEEVTAARADPLSDPLKYRAQVWGSAEISYE